VEDFAATFAGGFDGPGGLHDQLLRLGDEGERLWIKLTQGTGRNDAAQARANIEEVRRALEQLQQTASTGVNVTYNVPSYEAPEGDEVPEFHSGSGGIRDFGAGTLAMLHGREGVYTDSQVRQLAGGRTGGSDGAPAVNGQILSALQRMPEMLRIAMRDALLLAR
jgi:plasmid stabilization system protein ParE